VKEALYYTKLKNKIVQCELCPNLCILKEEAIGKCKTRKNVSGKLVSLSYGNLVAVHIDSIFKKPLYHFLPGTDTFSIGSAGCTMSCQMCQNWEISQRTPSEVRSRYFSPEDIVKVAKENKCPSISYTYTEPITMYEYVLETAKIAKKEGLKNIFVSNGYINPKPLKELCRYIDAVNIDLKAFNEKFYQKICSAKLKPVLETLKILKKEKVWFEITNLIIPTLNDNLKEIEKMCKWIKQNLGANVPIHFSRFLPNYKLKKIESTPEETLKKARDIAMKAGLRYIYIGNILIPGAEDTYCPKCKKVVIKRSGFYVTENNLKRGECICGEKIKGAWV